MNANSEFDLLSFLPVWPSSGNAVLWVSLTLVLAALLGEIAFRRLRLPRVFGYALVGAIVAAFGEGIAGSALNPSLRMIVDLALALLLFELGSRIHLSWLRRNPWLLATSLLESALTFVVVYVALGWLGLEGGIAAAVAAILIGTSPAVVMQVTDESRASGQVTERLIMFTGLNTLYAVLLTHFIVGWLNTAHAGHWTAALAYPSYLLVGSAIVASMFAAAVAQLARRLDLRDENSTLMLLGLILLALAVTKMANLSTLLVPLLAGMILRNTTKRPWVWPRHFGTAGGVLVLLLFVISGSVWSPQALLAGAGIGLVLILARQAAKSAAVYLFSSPSGLTSRQGIALGLGMAPISGATIVMLADLQQMYPHFTSMLTHIVIAAVALLELLGPIAVHYALRMVREQNLH